jgi:hypothetical protein
MKKLFLFQIGNGNPDPWDDAINIVNMSLDAGLGMINNNNADKYNSVINFMQKVDRKFIITPTDDPHADLVLRKPYSVDDYHTPFKITLDYLTKIMEGAPDVFMFATDLAKTNNDHNSAVENASFYMRNPENGEVTDIVTADVLKNPTMIPWFFCFKTKDFPLYYVVFNPNLVQVSGEIDGEYAGDNHVFEISGHIGNVSKLLFQPKFSRNVREIGEHNIFVKGNEFTVEPFGAWFVKRHLPEFFKEAKIKVDTNFDYRWEDNKIVLNTNDKVKGYLSIRWNSGTVMDMTFKPSKNRFFKEYVVDVIE